MEYFLTHRKDVPHEAGRSSGMTPCEETLNAGIRSIPSNTGQTEGQGKTHKFSDPMPMVFEGLNKI